MHSVRAYAAKGCEAEPTTSNLVSKRIFDLLVALLILVVASPLMLVIAAVVAVTSPGGAIYRARRVGSNGRPFTMYKFRSMVADADRVGPLVTAGGDARVTHIGRWLRRTKLDELPELWNVVRGEMSLVGPRPENEKSVALYTDQQKLVLSVRPGITSAATVKYRDEEDILAGARDLESAYYRVMQDKLAIELEYLRNRSFVSDLRILAETGLALLR